MRLADVNAERRIRLLGFNTFDSILRVDGILETADGHVVVAARGAYSSETDYPIIAILDADGDTTPSALTTTLSQEFESQSLPTQVEGSIALEVEQTEFPVVDLESLPLRSLDFDAGLLFLR